MSRPISFRSCPQDIKEIKAKKDYTVHLYKLLKEDVHSGEIENKTERQGINTTSYADNCLSLLPCICWVAVRGVELPWWVAPIRLIQSW